MNQEDNLNLVKRCNELCDQRDSLTQQRDDLLAALRLVNQCHICKYGYSQTELTCPDEADAELPCAEFIEKYDGLNFVEAAIAKYQKAEEIR